MENSIDSTLDTLNESELLITKIDSTCSEALIYLDEANSMLDSTKELSDGFRSSVNQITAILNSIITFIQSGSKDAPEVVKEIMKSDSAKVGKFMSAPVTLETQIINKIQNNGTGISPFFTNLAF